MVKEGRRKLGARADASPGGMRFWIGGYGHIRRNQKMCPMLVRSVLEEQ